MKNKEKYFEVMVKRLMQSIKKSARTGKEKSFNFGRKERIIIDITEEQLLERLIKTDGRCEITGYPFPLVCNEKYYIQSQARILGFNPLMVPSPDRIDSNGIYTMNNLQIVIQGYNMGKGDKTQAEMDEYMSFFEINNIPDTHTIYKPFKNEEEEIYKPINQYIMETNNTIPQIELIKTLIDHNESEHALKYYMQSMFSNKVVANVSIPKKKKGKDKTNSIEEKYGAFYAIRKDYIETNSVEVNNFNDNHISLLEVMEVKDNHAIFATKLSDLLVEKNIQIFHIKKGRGYKYAINKTELHKLK